MRAADGHQANRPAVVGTYRLLRQPLAEEYGGFYTAGEFDIGGLIARHDNLQFLELGRSCVLAPYRNKRTVELLWHGIWAYVAQNRLDVMIGCASLDGTEPKQLALPLSFLHHYARAPEAWRARALPERYVEMNRMSKETIDPKEALRAAAADQRLSAARRLYRRRRGGRPRVRHHRRADRAAGVGDQEALYRAFRSTAGGRRKTHNRRSATSSTRWLSLFFRIRSARWRVGKIFSCRLSRLMRSQIDAAVSVASSSDKPE